MDNDLVIFDWFVLSMRMQVILDSLFARPGSVPIWGGKKGEFRDWTSLFLFHCNYDVSISDLSFDLNNKDSFSLISNRISKTNFLVWAGLRRSIPSILKNCTHKSTTGELSLKIGGNIFEVTKKKSKHYYTLLVSRKALFPTIVNKLQNDEFHFTLEKVKQIFMIPHSVALETCVKAFQYKFLNSILYTNAKLYKIGFKLNDLCSFCSPEPETLYHFLYLCPFSVDFWRDFEVFWHQLLKENIRSSLQDIFG